MKPKLIANNITITILSFALFAFSNIAMAFTDTDGKNVSLNDYLGNGKFTVLEVWSTDCHLCREHMPDMVKFDGKLKNTQILGVSIDGQPNLDSVDDFMMQYNMKFTNLITNPIEMNIWMQQNTPEGLIGTPTFMMFDPEGQLFAMQGGPVGVDQMEKLILSKSNPVSAN